ncbi:MAG: IPT/TIG domain-containing protein, partial [Patescibacteria group bacterium]
SRTATRIRLTSIPAVTAAGTAAVSVAGATGSLTFTYDAPGTTTDTTNPDISYLDPTSGMADADVVVTIVGTHFGTTSGTVTFGQYTATISSWTDTQIKVTAPKLGQIASSVSYEVRVTRSDGKYDTSYYTYLAPASTGGGTGGETADTGMPMGMWAGLISANGVLAFLVKRKFL